MAQHLILLLLDDDTEDITSKEKLDEFVSELKGCTHFSLTSRQYYEVPNITDGTVDLDEGEDDWMTDMLAEMQEEIAKDTEG
jgi:hypothetical protein